MKKILGLDLGTNSIGWALVNEAETENEESSIIKLGVRVNPLTVDEKSDFEKGKPLSTNADRTLKRGARRNLQRFKLRRQNLIEILKREGWIDGATPLTEVGKNTTHQTLQIRAKAAVEKISLQEFARVLLAINKKRGYKSSRKTNDSEDGNAIDGMFVAKEMYDNGWTPGQYALNQLNLNKKYIPDFYRSDLKNEFDIIWAKQKQYYHDILNAQLYDELQGKNKSATWAICKSPFDIVGIKLNGNKKEQLLTKYELRVQGMKQKLDLEHLAIVLQEINNQINQSSGYLGEISDRSKKLYFNKITVGQYLYDQIKKNPHNRLKNQVFYRQDYLDEFEKIWVTQSKFHSKLNIKLKEEIRDVVIFYQRKLKSQKALLSFCQFESWEEIRKDKNGEIIIDKGSNLPKKRTVGHRVIPKSSPLFQEFKIWQSINNLEFRKIGDSTFDLFNQDQEINFVIENEDRSKLFNELNIRDKMSESQILKLLKLSPKEWKTNYSDGIEGNKTNKALYDVFQLISENEGYGFDWAKKSANKIRQELTAVFDEIGIKSSILNFDSSMKGNAFTKQDSYSLWHLLYSAEDDGHISESDKLKYGNTSVALKKNICEKFGFTPQYASMIANINLQDDYGNLSARAIRKLMPHLQNGLQYWEACVEVGYNHSNSLTKEEQANRTLKPKLELLKKNSLRNPVVEKILNQMVNLVNQLIEQYGKPDEVRIELARELKKSAAERSDLTSHIRKATAENEDLRKLIQKEFNFYPTKSDLVRYKLYEELKINDYKTIFSDRYINKDKIFSKEIDIEHIIPKAVLFDDSYSNKTLAFRDVNLKKGDRTAFDFISQDYLDRLETYVNKVEYLYNENAISKGKYKKLLMSIEDLPSDFIERDLRNSQYIAKKAKSMLEEVARNVISTTGRITDKLRSDWGLVNVMKELNLPKYRAMGMTQIEERYDIGDSKIKTIETIQDWTKRNDHRHHAMDALTVAFTTHNHIQYINNLNASRDSSNPILYGIRNKITHVVGESGDKKRRFVPPIPNFRSLAKDKIEEILISYKAKNKVVTKNINKTKKARGYNQQVQLTPRGQLHKETVYGRIKQPMQKPTKINKRLGVDEVMLIIDKNIRKAVLEHLSKYNKNPLLAFDTKILRKDPIVFNGEAIKEVNCFEEIYTIRKEIGPDLKLDKVIDDGIKEILQNRLDEFNGKAKEAFSNLEENPIWLNKEKGIAIKRVTIKGVNNVESLHVKKDHFGKPLLDKKESPQAVDFVSTGNNHHVAIYLDKKGNLQEDVVSFFTAVARVNEGLPIIDKSYKSEEGWQFLFTMKQNEMFVFPSESFHPDEFDLLDPDNYPIISKHLFRVQKISTKNYLFAHHLETKAITGDDLKYKKELSGKNYFFIQTPIHLKGVVKIRINHIGQIVGVGEY